MMRRRGRLRAEVSTIVVIYAENRAFDNLYGNFPGAVGLARCSSATGGRCPRTCPQRDRDGTVLPVLPPTWGGVTAAGYAPVVTQAQSAGLPNAPFSIEHAFTAQSGVTLSDLDRSRAICGIGSSSIRCRSTAARTTGMPHGPMRAASPWGTTTTAGRRCTRSRAQYVLADHFFQGAFGGSFLNHQYLICACAPEYPDADSAAAKPSIAVLEQDAAGHYLPRLKTAPGCAARRRSTGRRQFVQSGNIAPANYFGDGKFYAVNTMQPPYQPSGNPPAAADVERAVRRSREGDHLAAAERRHHRRSARREEHALGLVRGRLGCGAGRRQPACRRRCAA